MRIKQISVNGLFGIFDHVIPLNMDDRITIITGPNGFGKTAILRIVNGFFNSRYSELRTIPFSKFKIEFDDGSDVEIIKNNENQKESQKNNLIFQSKENIFPLEAIKIRFDIVNSRLDIIDDFIPELQRINSKEWVYLPTKEIISSQEVIERFNHLLPANLNWQEEFRKEPEWLEKMKANHIRLIETQRLLNLTPNHSSRNRIHSPKLSTVSKYSDELAKLMQDKFKEYGNISQSLDRTFPVRVVKQQPSSDLTGEELREQLNELEETRSQLIEVGFLDKGQDSEFQIQPDDIDESTKNTLSVYIEDVGKKMSVFQEISKKIELFRKIINTKFAYSYKEINFSKEKGFIFTTLYNSSLSELKTLSPTDLSSGEQHELILIYELLFKVQPNSLVLIDEPELSLHVGWQIQFLKDLQEITKLADLDILVATHSPDIIQDRWDLTVELKGKDK